MQPDQPVLLITGASSGIGAATARIAHQAGYRLVLTARSEDKLKSLQAKLGGHSKTLALACDVQQKEDLDQVVKQTLNTFGQLDAVFANAGRGGTPGGFTDADAEQWKELLLTNVLGVAHTIQSTLPAIKESSGHILITGSVAGRVPIKGSMYSATKWAVSGIGYNLREELKGTGVRVTLIEPGMVNTPFFDEEPEHALQDEDIANAVLYALSQPPHVDVNEILVRPVAKSS